MPFISHQLLGHLNKLLPLIIRKDNYNLLYTSGQQLWRRYEIQSYFLPLTLCVGVEPAGVAHRTDHHRNVVQHQPVVPVSPADGLGTTVGALREGCREGGVVAAVKPPPAAVADRTVVRLPLVVVVVVGGEGTAVVLGCQGVRGQVAGEAVNHQAELLGLVFQSVGEYDCQGKIYPGKSNRNTCK